MLLLILRISWEFHEYLIDYLEESTFFLVIF